MPHTAPIGDLVIPVGLYEVKENGQAKSHKRHRNLGTVMETTFEDGGRSMFVRLNIEMLSMEMQILLRANKLIAPGDDSISCNIYRREAKPAADGEAPTTATAEAGYEPSPF
jgi:hypothetical protein